MARRLNSDELGAKGESKFRELCLDARLTPNGSDRDRVGWDYVVTWPLVGGMLLDRRPAPVVCHVQLKTVWAGNDRVRLNLGTLEHIVKDSRPAFVVVAEVSEADLAFVGVRLIHIADEFLGEVLKRLRQAQVDGRSAGDFTVSATKWGVALPAVTGDALRSAMEGHVGSSMADYGREKQRQLDELGYERGRFGLSTTLQAGSDEEMIDGFLGIRPMRVLEARRFDTRFGIEVPIGSFDPTDAVVEVKPDSFDRCVVTVTRQDGGGSLSFTGEVFTLPSGVVGSGRVVLEVRTGLFAIRADMVRRAGKTDVSIKLRLGGDLGAMSHQASVWRDFYRLVGWTLSEPLIIEMRTRKRIVTPLRSTTTPRSDSAEVARMERLAAAADVVDWALVRAGAPATRLAAEAMFKAADRLDLLKTVERDPDGVVPPSFTTRGVDWFPESSERDALYLERVPIGGAEIAWAARTKLRADRSGQSISWTAGRFQLAVVAKIKSDDDAFRRFVARAKRITGLEEWFAPDRDGAALDPGAAITPSTSVHLV